MSTALNQIPAISPSALRHEVVRRLLEAIFRHELEEGTRLIAQKLAKQFGISATPVREALLELELVGVVEFPHNRGAIVKAFGQTQLRDIYHLRRILEAEATRCACGHLDKADLQRLEDTMTGLLQENDGPEWSRVAMESDQELHEAIAEHCGNPRLADEIRRYNTLIQTAREVAENQHSVQTQALLEHLPIIDALLAKEADVAASQMARHIDSTAESVAAIMFQKQ